MQPPICALASLGLIGSILFPGAATAHQFWIEPERHVVSGRDTVAASLKVGDDFQGESFPYLSHRFISFSTTTSDGVRDLSGHEGDDPAVNIDKPPEGLLAISYHSTGDIAEFQDDWDLFNEYLAEEGLDWVAKRHVSRGLSTTAFSEVYYRCAKTLIQVGDPRPGDSDAYTGMPFEFVAEDSPHLKAEEDGLTVTLLWQGEPYSGARVTIVRDDGDLHKSHLTTDEAGRVTLPRLRTGRYLVTSVHMQEAPDALEPVWESHWASLTFEIGQTDISH